MFNAKCIKRALYRRKKKMVKKKEEESFYSNIRVTLFFTSFFVKKKKVNIEKNIQQSSIKFIDGLSVSLFDFVEFFLTTLDLDSCCRFHPQRFSLYIEFE